MTSCSQVKATHPAEPHPRRRHTLVANRRDPETLSPLNRAEEGRTALPLPP